MKQIFNTNLNLNHVGELVNLKGWVAKTRNLGGLIFIDLRDRSGIIQLVIKPENEYYELAQTLKNEYVIEIDGMVTERESKNKHLVTGEIEIAVGKLVVLNTSSETPFEITDDSNALEDTKLKYRYLDLRRSNLKNNIIQRHKITSSVREYLNSCDFIEIETPILCKSTPEGARDYLVPSRVSNGRFYALPQSPQIFKQLLMVSGFERYYQIARCFRDEDLRADRQPEFTQIDMEMSFIDEIDIQNIVEGMMVKVFKDIKKIELKVPFERMTYDDAMNIYGSDKPDTRFDMKIQDITDIFSNSDFSLFKQVIDSSGIINCLVVKDGADKYSRKDIDVLTEYVKKYQANNLLWLKYNQDFTGSIIKYLSDEELNIFKNRLDIRENDLILIVADKTKIVKNSLGNLRLKLGHDLNLIDESKYNFLWVIDFPLFEYSEEDNRYYACHHPFTSPKDNDIDKLISNPGNCYAKAYDIVLNGYEVGGGSIRIHKSDIQAKMFKALGFTEEEAQLKFGFLLNAFKYGTPPHGGIALGLERLVMLLCNTDNIKDVVAFPKTASASCLMTEAPNIVSKEQLDELGISLIK
ncbi:MAG: aspartate--tRNA ligase [Bacilli bacterium]|nr:aspartate--tRNA ligase [Bacilli bacterium]MDD4808426.1 aspartate--tRNA ligase [Bacilli bacterium]